MAFNLMELVSKQLTPDLVSKMGGIVGESPSTVTRAASLGIPTILEPIAQRGSTESGARGIIDAIRAGGYDSADPSTFGSMLERDDTRAMYMQRGQGLLSSLFGDGLENTLGAFSTRAGLSPGAGGGILAMLAPLVMTVLGRHVRANNLSAAGLSRLLRHQSGARAVAHKRSSTGLWALLAGAAVAAGGFLLCSRTSPNFSRVTNEPERPIISEPEAPTMDNPPIGGGPLPEAPSGFTERAEGMDALGQYLEGTSESTGAERFELEGLTFETNGSNLSNQGYATVDRLADMLEKHPNAKISINGFTDNTGAPETNQTLSQARAESVKQGLIERGIDASRIEAAGHGPEQPVADNATEEGRKLNRRTEVVVKSK